MAGGRPSREAVEWNGVPAFSQAETEGVTPSQMVGVSSTTGLWISTTGFHPAENSMKSARVG